MKIRVNVTQEDILAGEKFSCVRCPIGIALNRAANSGVYHVGVDIWAYPDSAIVSRLEVPVFRAPLPQEAKDFILYFDNRTPSQPYPQPFEFEIDLPEIKTKEK